MIHSFDTVASNISCTSCIFKITLGQTTAVILFTPEATASCPIIEKHPMSLVFIT
ncbi:MAG: hypothetical protein WCL02_09620 [bacterium]